MKLLFVHDTKIKEDKNGTYYTGGSYSQEVWDRYLAISNEFSVIARKDPLVYNADDAQQMFNYFDNDKINFIEVPDLSSSIKGFLNVKKHLKRNKVIMRNVLKSDIVIARVPSVNGNIAINFAKKFKKPYLVEVVGCSWDSLWNYNIKGKLLAPINFLKQKKAVSDASFAVYVTRDFLQKRYPTKGESVNCSNVSLTNFSDVILNNRIEKIVNMNNGDKVVIGTIGALNVKYKGQESVIKAISALKKQGIDNFEYQLVGGGDNSYLSSVAKEYDVIEQVKFLGSMPHREIFNWLDNIDIYAQPSRTEGLPRALIEAMSRGLLSIGTNAGGIPELLEEKYIFSKSSENINEIVNILKEIETEGLIAQAKRNFYTSKEYDKNLIEGRRHLFFKKFISQTYNSSLSKEKN